MIHTGQTRPDPHSVLARLRDFQRRTVQQVFRRMYLDPEPAHRYLVADEVGLGKTYVARGLVACVVDHLWERVDRIDIVYVCSSADIARQNVPRLQLPGLGSIEMATRITLLPAYLNDLRKRKVNFVALTPATSFDVKSGTGTSEERELLYWMLHREWNFIGLGPGLVARVFQGSVASIDTFRRTLTDRGKAYADSGCLSGDVVHTFVSQPTMPALHQRFRELASQLSAVSGRTPDELRRDCDRLVGELRSVLARACMRLLEPDLVILDEFHRFKDLLHNDDEAAQLARELFAFSDERSAARVLMLSATPYRMYTPAHERESDDHHRDFLGTLEFLHGNADLVKPLASSLASYGRELREVQQDRLETLRARKSAVEGELRRVIVRTEKLSATGDRNGMLRDAGGGAASLEADDIRAYLSLQHISRLLEFPCDTLEYWKSTPYALNFMDGYDLDQRLRRRSGPQTDLATAIRAARRNRAGVFLRAQDVANYKPIEPANPRLRDLIEETIGRGLHRHLWMPPSLPYYITSTPQAAPTKRLIFSSWRVVPRMISALVSYEAERRAVTDTDADATNTERRRATRRLRFSRDGERLTGMPITSWLYPSFAIAAAVDPLQLSLAGLRPVADLIKSVGQVLAPRLERLKSLVRRSGPDELWYSAAPVLLDIEEDAVVARDWFNRRGLAAEWSFGQAAAEDHETAWGAHVERLRDIASGRHELGEMPDDLLETLALIAIGGPAVLALRTLSRLATSQFPTRTAGPLLRHPMVRLSAARIGWAFRRLYDGPEGIAVIRTSDASEAYWRRVLEYGIEGNLQAVLDEYGHILAEDARASATTPDELVAAVARQLFDVLSLRTATLRVRDVRVSNEDDLVDVDGVIPMRAHFALQLVADRTEEERSGLRKQQVMQAFNSPFWPFILTTTSIGQEGLDFHRYCHAVVHWNLPSNPVDLEQREGRIHRYKGHAVRRNIAASFGLQGVADSTVDLWAQLFDRAESARTGSDLLPYWVFEAPATGGCHIERHVPVLPMSREIEQMKRLRRALALYRLVFGQPRQDDLLAELLRRLPEDRARELVHELGVDLSPRE